MAVMRLNFFSRELGMATNVTAILPSFDQGFDVGYPLKDIYGPEEKFPVLWLLHGGSGDDADYLNWTNVARYAVEYNCAVICPCDYNAGYSDYPRGVKYYRYLTEELWNFIFSRFPNLSDKREDNFIGGLSMGSGGALKMALDKCDRFSYALIMSGGIPPKSTGAGNPTTGHAQFREKMIAAGWAMPKQPNDIPRSDIHNTVETKIAQGANLPVFIMACGDKDPIAYNGSVYGAKYLKELGCEVIQFILPDYRHEWDFWEICLRKAFAEWLPVKRKVVSRLLAGTWDADPVKE